MLSGEAEFFLLRRCILMCSRREDFPRLDVVFQQLESTGATRCEGLRRIDVDDK